MAVKQTDRKIKIALAGGGTGGHVQPVVAVVKALRESYPDLELIWIGEKGSREGMAADECDVHFKPVTAGKIRRYLDIQNLVDPFKVAYGYGQALKILTRFKPDGLFSKAGYVAAPVLSAAATLKIPIVAHESDTVMGLTNRLASTLAKTVCTGFPLRFYPPKVRKRCVYTGNPIGFGDPKTYADAGLAKFDLNDDLPVVLVLGGSQGALKINEIIWRILPELLSFCQIIHQTGQSHLAKAEEVGEHLPKTVQGRYYPVGLMNQRELGEALYLSKMAVSRAGANTIADLSWFGVPAIFIPLPNAASDHQTNNARFVEEKGGGVVMTQDHLEDEQLLNSIQSLLYDQSKLDKMSLAARVVNPRDAANSIVTEIMRAVR